MSAEAFDLAVERTRGFNLDFGRKLNRAVGAVFQTVWAVTFSVHFGKQIVVLFVVILTVGRGLGPERDQRAQHGGSQSSGIAQPG